MKKYDLIIGFGCSFMEGGGLDNRNIYKFLNNINLTIEVDIKDCLNFKYKNNFITFLAEKLKCESFNFGESMSSNDLIFKKIYEYFKEYQPDNGNILVIGQISMLSRQYVYYDYLKKYMKLNRLIFSDPPFLNQEINRPLFNYYENYLSFIYNEEEAYNNVLKNIDLYSNWLNSKKIDTIWLSYDGNPNQFIESNNFIKFNGDNIGAWAQKNKMRLCDIPNINSDDLHLSIEGHKIIANTIYEKIRG